MISAVKSVTDSVQALMQAGKPADAERLLRDRLADHAQDAELRLMLGRVLASTGRKAEALQELLTAVQLAPNNRVARLLLARIANELRRPTLAAEHARALTQINPRDAEAWSALGTAAHGLRRKREAEQAFRRAVELIPTYSAARFNLASLLADQERSEDALVEAELAERHGSRSRAVTLLKARALVQLDRLDEAESLLSGLLRDDANDVDAYQVLIQMRQLSGAEDPLRELRGVASAPSAPALLRRALADAERRVGNLAASERALRSLLADVGANSQLRSSLSTVLLESGRVSDALVEARAAYDAYPDDASLAENFVVAAFCAGAHTETLTTIERFRAQYPRDQRWITYRIDLARLLHESEFAAWFDTDALVTIRDLPAPRGFRNIAEFHAALQPVLESLHTHRRHPLGQSLRFGTQTSRNLLIRPKPEVTALLGLFDDALKEVSARLTKHPAHPFGSRNTSAPQIIGCWSVRLHRGGYHVNHIHPEGWISSAYYVSVPPEASDTETRAGWLKFGVPRFPVAGLEPLSFVQPFAGRLVLFPSYLWHGTQTIQQAVPRLSVAFDALPQAEIA